MTSIVTDFSPHWQVRKWRSKTMGEDEEWRKTNQWNCGIDVSPQFFRSLYEQLRNDISDDDSTHIEIVSNVNENQDSNSLLLNLVYRHVMEFYPPSYADEKKHSPSSSVPCFLEVNLSLKFKDKPSDVRGINLEVFYHFNNKKDTTWKIDVHITPRSTGSTYNTLEDFHSVVIDFIDDQLKYFWKCLGTFRFRSAMDDLHRYCHNAFPSKSTPLCWYTKVLNPRKFGVQKVCSFDTTSGCPNDK